MTTHRFPGLGVTPLMTYLAALGLAKVVGEQEDPAARFGWRNGVFHLETTVADVADFLVHRYVPTPVFSPWNAGSGFGAKDKTPLEYVRILEQSTSPRLAGYRATLAAIRQVLVDRDQAGSAWGKDDQQRKERTVQELRNRLPDEALGWIDAAVLLTSQKAVFPPLLGTGGNDGRLDFSTNVHQRLTQVLPDLGAAEARSLRWARDLLHGEHAAPLVAAVAGQGDPAGAGTPGSSPFGSAEGLVNPWAFVLMVEGAMVFAGSAAKRLGEQLPQAAIPFTVESSPDGPNPGAPDEEGRAELWAPVVAEASFEEFERMVEEARVSWDGGTARTAVAMYAAIHSFGVGRGIDAFQRFGFLKRNGLAYVAVPLDLVEVRSRPEVVLAREPLRRASRFRRASGEATATTRRRFDAAATAFVRSPGPAAAVAMLSAQTRMEVAAFRSAANREALARLGGLPAGGVVLQVCDDLFRASPEARVAVGIASATAFGPGGRPVAIRDLLVAHHDDAVVDGLGVRPTVAVLADLMVWLSQHPGDDSRAARGWLPWLGHRVRVDWHDTHAWAAGLLDDDLVTEHLLAFLAADWGKADRPTPWPPAPTRHVDPTLAILQALACGRAVPGGSGDDGGGAQGLDPAWPLLLRADRVAQVHQAASRTVNRCEVTGRTSAVVPATCPDRVAPPGLGPRILAALTASASTSALLLSAPTIQTTENLEGDRP